jgi:gliding motility-associated-like protein
MKTVIFVAFLMFFSLFSIGQACLTTNQINLNTGINPSTNAVLGLGSNDPRWIIDNANNIPGATNNTPAIVCTPSGGSASNPNSTWIGFATTSSYITNNPTIGYYIITYRMPFRTCADDSLFFNFNIANDNYFSDIRIDGVSTGISQPVSLVTTNWSLFTPYNFNGYYLTGNHTIEIDVQNYNVTNAVNPQMLNIHGNINSLSNSIVSYASPANCICNASSSVTANFITSVPNGCDSSIIQFTDLSTATNSTIVSWNWYFGDGNSSSSQNPLHNYTGSGTFQAYLVVTNSTNQTDTFYQTVISIENSINIQGIANPTSVCPGSYTVFTGSGANTYSWSGGVTNGVPFIPSTTATYTVTGTDINGCTNTATVLVTVNPLPNVGAVANPANICPGNTTMLTGSGASTYTWTSGVTNGVAFAPAATATYTVTGVDANGCSNTSSVTVYVNLNLPINVTPPTSILCLGDSVQLTASGATNYNWSILPGLSSYTGTSVFAYPTSTTTYTVTGADAAGCSGTTVVTIDVINEIDISISKNSDAECNINTVQLLVIGAQNYTWIPANFLSNPTGSSTNATVAQTTTFYVTGTTGSCTDMDSIVVYHYNNDEASIFIPSAFSPNSDGLNDCFRIRHQANFKEYYFTIYNRWGEKVFETNSADDCWDGMFKNEFVEIGTYFYFLKAETNCGKIFLKGDITLIK